VVVPHVTLATAALAVARVADKICHAACSLRGIPPAHCRCRHAADLVAAVAAALATIITSFPRG